MITVIVAGGSGTRLWPLSTADKPKHLLRLTGGKSLLQSTYERASALTNDIYVLTDESHNHLVEKQLPKLKKQNIIVEPGRRGTANCITLALAHIAKTHGVEADIAFFHADHHINDVESFAAAVKKAVLAARQYDSIALIGIEPEYPSTGFGYIKMGEKIGDAYWVDSFEEKPDSKKAKKYLESGEYLWNLGLFAAPVKTFLSAFDNHAAELSRAFNVMSQNLQSKDRLKDAYSKLKNQPIDTALIEKTPHVVVVPGKFDWIDIGSYKDLYNLLDSGQGKNTILGNQQLVHLDKTKSSLVMAYDKPIAVIGLKDVVVIHTEEGILVCHKDYAQDVKKAAEKFRHKH